MPSEDRVEPLTISMSDEVRDGFEQLMAQCFMTARIMQQREADRARLRLTADQATSITQWATALGLATECSVPIEENRVQHTETGLKLIKVSVCELQADALTAEQQIQLDELIAQLRDEGGLPLRLQLLTSSGG